MRREWAGTSGSARAGRETTDTYIVSTIRRPQKRRETDRRGWKRNKKGGGSQIVTASHCGGGGGPRNPLLETNSWAGFPSKKKGKKTHAASVRPGWRLLIIPHPPTICAPHTRLDLRIGWKKNQNQNNFCPVIHAENVGHTRLPQLTVLIRERAGGRKFPSLSFRSCVVYSCRGETRK